MRHALILGDPSHFRIKAGRNAYTRNALGFRKKVDLGRAKSQWQNFKGTLEGLGAQIHVVPAHPDLPGLVFPANAGFLHPKYERIPLANKTFYLSTLIAHRAAETQIHRKLIESLGPRIGTFAEPFEGEADFFPCGEFYIFTYGDVVPMGFRPRLGIPPWYFRFSHRSGASNLDALQKIVAPAPVLALKLSDPRYYHGDTAFFAFGPKREYLLAYLEALDAPSREKLTRHLGSRLIPLSKADAEGFAANSFQMETPDGPRILFPPGLSDALLKSVSKIGVPYSTVDVSEFFSKGGGSIKCMICDLGPAG